MDSRMRRATMSRFSHRQPIFTWSSVVLLSTLLLAPGVSAAVVSTLLESLTRTYPQQAAHSEAARTNTQPRRSAEDEEALRAAARDGAAYVVHFDTDPDNPEGGIAAAIAVLLPTRITVAVPDNVALTSLSPDGAIPLPCRNGRETASPRAPPV
jgi:hypothetical protein